jgi:ribA/ribD-fused uncharacterized protein
VHNGLLQFRVRFQDRDSKNRPRPIIVCFNWFADRDRVWLLRNNLRGSGIHIEEDQPAEIEARRSRLLPIFKKALTMSAYNKRTFLNGDRLTINGTHYTVENLDDLPEDLDPRLIATQTDGVTTIFFGQNSPLSNHHPSPMSIDKHDYLCNEQWYFAKRAELMGDDAIHNKVMAQSNPKEMMRYGRKAHNYNNINVEAAETATMTRGVREKFDQNPRLKDFLISTQKTKIGESCMSNKRWGTGFYLGQEVELGSIRHRAYRLSVVLHR